MTGGKRLLTIKSLPLTLSIFFLLAARTDPLFAQKPAPSVVNSRLPNKINSSRGSTTNSAVEQAKPLIPLSERHIRPVTKPFVVTGEVVDAWCYASQTMGAGRGEAHKPCALACIGGGITPGIVDDQGTLYVAAKYTGFNGCRELLMPYVAKRVTVTGWLTTKGGCNIIKIMKVEPEKQKSNSPEKKQAAR
jgi:hypothetical protein